MEDKRKIELVCYYCSKEIVLPYKEEEEKLKGSVWFCSDYCKDTFVNIQINRKTTGEGEREELQ
ncbi:MAG TPA: hypothetical protein VE524_06525 [Nitrososphaeraceae archaeon]|nr:hypothetical protein [Nitrososphaeraceae archaeon]